MFVFLTIIVACFQTFQVKSQDLSVQPSSEKLGFRFVELPECYLVTEVAMGYGAAQAGLQVGDCIEAVDGETGSSAVEALRDTTRSSVLLQYRPVLEGLSKQVSVHRGVYQAVTSDSTVHPMLTAASNGELKRMIEMLEESVDYEIIERATPLLARFYPQLLPNWLMSLQDRADRDLGSGLLIQY